MPKSINLTPEEKKFYLSEYKRIVELIEPKKTISLEFKNPWQSHYKIKFLELWLKDETQKINDFDININQFTPIDYLSELNVYLKREDLFMTANNEHSKQILSKFSKPRGIQDQIEEEKDKIFITIDTKYSKAGLWISNMVNYYNIKYWNNNQLYSIINTFFKISETSSESVYQNYYAFRNILKILKHNNTKVFIFQSVESLNEKRIANWITEFYNISNIKQNAFEAISKSFIAEYLTWEYIKLPMWLRTPEAVYSNYQQLKHVLEKQIHTELPINIFATAWSMTISSWLALCLYNEIYLWNNEKLAYLKGRVKLNLCSCWMKYDISKYEKNSKELEKYWMNIDMSDFDRFLKEYIVGVENYLWYGYSYLEKAELKNWLKLNEVYEAKWFNWMLAYLEKYPEEKEKLNLFWLIWAEEN